MDRAKTEGTTSKPATRRTKTKCFLSILTNIYLIFQPFIFMGQQIPSCNLPEFE